MAVELAGSLVAIILLLACKQWRTSNATVSAVYAVLPVKSGIDGYQRHYCRHVVERVDLCCCYCRPGGAAVAAADESRSYAALLLLLHSSQAEATTADNKQQVDAMMMQTFATDNNQPATAGKVGIWGCRK